MVEVIKRACRKTGHFKTTSGSRRSP